MRRLALLLLAGCGGTSSFTNDAPIGNFDANTCSASFTVTPPSPTAPTTLTATASVSGSGFISITWQVVGPDGMVPVSFADETHLRVTFSAPTPGPYTVDAEVARAFVCRTFPVRLNVAGANANHLDVRLRFAPLPGQGAPPQLAASPITILGGADHVLPAAVQLRAGATVSGTISGPGGAALPAYLRLGTTAGDTFELFADTLGRYAALTPPDVASVRVVPYGDAVAPQDFAGALAAAYTLDAGDPLVGTVRDSGGNPVAGARVAAGVGSLPPLLATTGADGRFATRIRLGMSTSLTTLTVVPPSGAAIVQLPFAVPIAAGADLDVRLPALATAGFQGRAVSSGGAPLPGAVVTLVATGTLAAGTLVIPGQDPLPLKTTARASAIAGAGGLLPALTLPVASWQALVDPGPGDASGEAIGAVALAAGTATADLAAAAPVATAVTVTTKAGAKVAGARVVAVAAGLHGVGAGLASAGESDANGVATVALAPGMAYTLVVDGPEGMRLVRGHGAATGGAAAPAIALDPALELSGTVVFPGGSGEPGVGVEVLCGSCSDLTPIASTVTTGGGEFTLLVPDPGVQTP